MVNPDGIVASRGESVSLERITVPIYANGTLDEAASTKETVATVAVVSQPRQLDVPSRLQGHEVMRLTVLSTLDVRADRPGRADRVTVRGRLFEVVEVRPDTHALRSNVAKKTVLLAQLGIPQGSA